MNPHIVLLNTKEEVQALCEKHGINYLTRWEDGVLHHPKAVEIFGILERTDFLIGSDFYCWKSGGDGDNGETLMFELSIYFELQDALKISIDKGDSL